MLGNRDFAINMARIFRLVTLGLIVLTLASWAMPAFSYSGYSTKETQDTISLWGFLGFTKNYPQIQEIFRNNLGDPKFYVKMATINVPLTMAISGIFGILTLAFKKGVATTLFPLVFSAYGLYGYLTDDFMQLANVSYSKIIQIILIIITLLATIISIYFNIVEIKTRPEDYYLPKLGDI